MKLQAIASCRVSTSEQLENGSIDRQDLNVNKAVIDLDVELVKIWSLGQSSRAGKNKKRKDLIQMYEYCKLNKRVKYLVVDEVDRFMRSIEEFYWWTSEFKDIGVTVYFASQPTLNGDDSMAKLMKLMEIYKAEASNDERAHKSSIGLKAAFQKGFYPSHTHQGYVKGKIAGWHEPDPLRAPQLKLAAQRVLSREYTPEESLRLLNASGYLTPSSKKQPEGQPLRIDKFKDILCCAYYAGIVEIKKYDLYCKGVHEPLWSERDYQDLVAIVKGTGPSKYDRQDDNPDFPLKAILRSDDCQAKAKITGFWKSNGKGWRGPKYRCRGVDEQGKACRKEYDQDTLHGQWEATLERVDLTQEAIERLMLPLRQIWQSKQKSTLDIVTSYQTQIDCLTTEKNHLVRSLVKPENASIKGDLLGQVEEMKDQITQLEHDKLDAQDIEKDFLAFAEFCMYYLAKLKANWWELDKPDMQAFANIIFPAGVWLQDKPQKIHTPQISSIFALARDNSNIKDPDNESESLMVELRGIAPRSARLRLGALQA